MRLEQAVDRGFGDKIALLVGEAHGKFARREFRLGKGEVDDLTARCIGDAVPDAIGLRRTIGQGFRATTVVAVDPAIECRRRDAQLAQRAASGQLRLLDDANGLELLGGGGSHEWSSPAAIMLIFSRRSSSAR